MIRVLRALVCVGLLWGSVSAADETTVGQLIAQMISYNDSRKEAVAINDENIAQVRADILSATQRLLRSYGIVCDDAGVVAQLASGDLAQHEALKDQHCRMLFPHISFALDVLSECMPPGRSLEAVLNDRWGVDRVVWQDHFSRYRDALNAVNNSRAPGATLGTKIALDDLCGYVAAADGLSGYAVPTGEVATSAHLTLFERHKALDELCSYGLASFAQFIMKELPASFASASRMYSACLQDVDAEFLRVLGYGGVKSEDAKAHVWHAMVPGGIGLDALVQYSADDCASIDTNIVAYVHSVQQRMVALAHDGSKAEVVAYAASADHESYNFSSMVKTREYLKLLFERCFALVIAGVHPRVTTYPDGVAELKRQIGWAGE